MMLIIKSFILSFSFLTWIPTPKKLNYSNVEFSFSKSFYPVVGLSIGCICYLIYWSLEFYFPHYVTAGFILMFLTFATRFLHLDGFMDCMDGFFGGHNSERRLEIMKDPHVGAFGTVGVIVLLLIKFSLIFYALESGTSLYVMIMFPVFSRWAMVLALVTFKYIRPMGIGSSFQTEKTRVSFMIANVLMIGIAILLTTSYLALIPILLVGCWTIAFGYLSKKLLGGGLTGDCYGAINETSEVIGMITLLILFNTNGLLG